MKKGDILQVQFPFTNQQGSKRRPALVLAVEAPDVTVAFIIGNLGLAQPYDVVLQPTALNRLGKPSLVRVLKIAMLDRSQLHGRVGELTDAELQQVNQGLRKGFQL
ncbi:type II toxin-antitoxin system PemK/MazF family toxin [Hymenobacter ruricola]|uniref:Type II toxin-antitoxin system PemK/MazF family toxin n=1 Tax=Hymenobacter ruricola TaxID=2791023 RepID=A0ABS0I6N8_9BACT|nr:type II toxin-antitoxin system PemK/MazF family toxin [Hymenobacter ruricola]MBF9222559.1 type II toxin-antitoxin system PemK/MazF family toxin [Hymenobacter ruricola]